MTETQQRFFARLNQLGSGERAALRREAGTMLREADGAALAAFYRCLPASVDAVQESKWFAVACMRCLWDAGEENGKPFERVIAELIKRSELSDSTRHRVEILLDTRWDSDGYMLTKLARLVKLIRQRSDRTMLDFPALLDDMIYWNSEFQISQRKWARTIFADDTTTDEKE
jgi:CRISPR type I-E-associated protein CasB/Cse2